MAQKNRLTRTVLFLWSFDGSTLTYGFLSGARYRQRRIRMKRLEHELLPLLLRSSKKGLRAIAVAPDALHGFAASRLIVTAVNTVCWMLDIPALSVPGAWDTSPELLNDRVRRSLKSSHTFTKPLAPRYDREANITMSNRKKSFTIT